MLGLIIGAMAASKVANVVSEAIEEHDKCKTEVIKNYVYETVPFSSPYDYSNPPVEEEEDPPIPVYCLYCDSSIANGKTKCPNCGAPVTKQTTKMAEENDVTYQCIYCGFKQIRPIGTRFCKMCGKSE